MGSARPTGALQKISRTTREKRVVRLRKMIKPEADRAGTGISSIQSIPKLARRRANFRAGTPGLSSERNIVVHVAAAAGRRSNRSSRRGTGRAARSEIAT